MASGLRLRDVILAATAAFIAWGWATYYVPSLRYLPHAFLLGAVTAILFAAFLSISTVNSRDDHGPVIPPIRFITPQTWEKEEKALKGRLHYRKKDLYPRSALVNQSLDSLLDYVKRDFINVWYSNISIRPTFTNEVDRAVRTALSNVLAQIEALDVVGLSVSEVIPVFTTHMSDAYAAERAVRGPKITKNVTESEELDLAIATKFRNGKLHPAASMAFADTRAIQQQHLRGIVMRLLPKLLPASMMTSPAVTVLIKEIVACAVLLPIVQSLADPDTWNQLLEAYGRTLLQERKTIRKLRAALDEHAPQSPRADKTVSAPKLSATDNERQFEKFIRAIRQCNNLSDARRFRSEVAGQLVRESAIDDQDPLYLRRLETGKRILDQKIAAFGARGSSVTTKEKTAPKKSQHTAPQRSKLENASLRDVLYNATGLSSFMEYMDRLRLMRLVQFWIVVDGFRNPLEEDAEDHIAYSTMSRSWSDSDRADIAQIVDGYLSRPEIKVSAANKDAVKAFLKAGASASDAQYQGARKAILQTQTAVYEQMRDPHFANFQKSDLWFKFLALDASTALSDPRPSIVREEASISDTTAQRPQLPARPTSTVNKIKNPDLLRPTSSATDLLSAYKPAEGEAPTRKSYEGQGSRKPLFDDDVDSDPLVRSTTSIVSDVGSANGFVNGSDPKVVDAMQAALNNILDDQPGRDPLFAEDDVKTPLEESTLLFPVEIARSGTPSLRRDVYKPSIASLGLVGDPARRGFLDDNIFGEEEKFLEDEREDLNGEEKEEDEIHAAAPGDLGLAEAIDALTLEIEKLVTQESIIDSLTKKAELTNNVAELRILRKSKSSIQREINRKELQRQQYIVQESDNSLYGRATVSIQSIMVGQDEDGKEFALYIVEVRRQAGEQMPAAAWVVTRRYSEFHELNKRLRARYPSIRNLEFPRRQVVLKLQKDFLQKRRVLLERWLQELLKVPSICRSRELRAFLSQQSLPSTSPSDSVVDTKDFVSRIYNSVTDGMEEFLGNIPVLDQLSVAGQNLISAATTQLNAAAPATLPGGSAVQAEALGAATEAEAELRAFEARELEPFVKPICDLFLEVFELNRENNWLRGRAVILVLHQLLGGTIERKVREAANVYTSEDYLARYINTVIDIMWPGGSLKKPSTPRTPTEKARSRREAGLVLASLVPELVGSVVGRANAQLAARRILATLNNQRLNTHLVFTLLDEIVDLLFGDGVTRPGR